MTPAETYRVPMTIIYRTFTTDMYKRSGNKVHTRMPLGEIVRRLPWQALFQSTYLFRRYVFAKRPESVDYMIVEDESPDTLRRLFLERGLMKGDYASYYYYGEEMNMVGGMFKPDEYECYQYHIRGFETEDGTRLRPHTELYWRVYPRKHVELVNLDVTEGIERTKTIFDEEGIEYRVVEVDKGDGSDE